MTNRKLTPLALALGFVLSSYAFAADPFFLESKDFTEDTVYTVDDTIATVATNRDKPIEITIADGKTLTLGNKYVHSQSKVIDGTAKNSLTFSGGNLVLRIDDNYGKGNSEQTFIRATDGSPDRTGTLIFHNASTLLEGTVPLGMVLHGDATFKNGFEMRIDRNSLESKERVIGALVQVGATLSMQGTGKITLGAGKNDTTINGIELGHGGNLKAQALDIVVSGNNHEAVTQLQGIYTWEEPNDPQATDMEITGPVTVTLQDAPKASSFGLSFFSERKHSLGDTVTLTLKNTDTALGVRAKYDADFADDVVMNISGNKWAYGLYASHDSQVNFSEALTMDFSGNSYAYGIFANNKAQVTVKTATLNMQDGGTYAIWLKDSATTEIAEAYETNAQYAAIGQNNSIIDVKKDFVTTAESGLSAENDAQIHINSTGTGKVQFSGFTEIDNNGQISLTVGSGATDEDSYWNVTDFSALTELTVAANASLNFLLTPELLGNVADDGAIVTVTGTPVLLHSAAQGASTITLSGTGLALNVGDEVRLINSDQGIALDDLTNLLVTGDLLDDLKGDLKVEHIASLSRVQENELSKDDYDLLMKSDQMLVATIKNKRPSTDRVNDQTNALMQSSIASAATMYAADELLIDSTMKSRQGVRQTGPFAAARVGKYDLDVTGDVDTTVISGLLGYAFNVQDSEVGVFMEMGHDTYDTRTATTAPMGETKGDGKHNYVGFGVYGNYATPIDWLHVTGYVKGGWLRSEFSVPLAGVNTDFDRTSNYWGAHLGAYGEFQVTEKLKSRTFLNYFYDGHESESYTASGSSDVAGAKFHFDSLNSHRAQLGSVFEYAYTPTLRPYAALTYEYTFKADAKGRATDQFGDLALNATDLEGSTGIASLGWTYQNEAKSFEFDLGVNGYTGKRQGVSAQAQAAWKF